MIRPVLMLIFFLVFATKTSGQEKFILKKDIQSAWLINTDNRYVSFSQSAEQVKTIYFSLNPDNFRGDYLVLTSQNQFSIMLDGKLLLDDLNSAELSIDSLKKNYPSSSFFFAVHQDEGIDPADLI